MTTIALMVTETKLITGAELEMIGDIGPCELVEGRIVLMSPTGHLHGEIELNLGAELRAFVRTHALGKVQVGEVGIYTRRQPDTVRAADILFISHERYTQQKSAGYLHVAPDLVVEILSPDDRWSEVMEKLGEYFAIGVRLIWVVDPRLRRVYVYRTITDVRAFTENDVLPGDDVLPGFLIPVAQLFES